MHNAPQVDALLIGYEFQNNLGLRSIAAVLQEQGWRVMLLSLSHHNREEVLEAIHLHRPSLIGFSIIFQFALEDYASLMRFLRENGIQQHFTAGGHFPTLRPVEVLQQVPQLDSIVRFEGEFTLLELIQRLNQPETWQNIQGLAFRQNGQIICTPPRPLITDLDSLPPIDYGQPKLVGHHLKSLAVLASRGCLFDCAFCSIRQFYGSAPGPLRRTRSPDHFVNELSRLYQQQDVRVFIFQDDDFAARTPAQRRWLEQFLLALDRTELTGSIAWKISCRVDDLDPHVLADCQKRGLAAVYLGVESGSEMGLRTLNKHVTVNQNLAAVQMLKDAGLAIAIGFMLFDPSTTFETIRENMAFLHLAAGDGAFPINFCKMLPYAGTPIEESLRKQGRLTGTLTHPDYSFLDPRVDLFAFFVQKIFHRRNFTPLGLANRLTLAQANQALNRTLGIDGWSAADAARLQEIISRSNRSALDTLEALLSASQAQPDGQVLMDLATQEWQLESDCILALDDLLLRSDLDLLEFFSQGIQERQQQLQPAARQVANG